MAEPRHRIMVVDDEADLRALVRLTLEDSYEVFEATNGLDALLKLARYEPDLAIIDIMMPLMDGHELCAKIRTTVGYQELPIIALSALDSRDDMRKGYEHGANVYLTKPFQPDRLLKNVELSLRSTPARQKTVPIEEVAEREARAGKKIAHAATQRASGQLPAATDTPVRARAGRGGVHTRLLIVDDDEDFVTIARMNLEQHGYEVLTAHDGLDALDKIPQAEPDIYVLDGMMPRMSGYQLLAMLRESADTTNRPVIFVSGKGDNRDRRATEARGADAYLAKPFPPEKLLEAVRDIEARPSFHVMAKSHPIGELLREIGRRKPVEDHSEEQKRLWKSYGKIGGFLRENRDKDPE